MVRASKTLRIGRSGWKLAALAAAAVFAIPALPAMADDDRGRGRDRGGDHGRYRDHDHGPGRGRGHDHDRGHSRSSWSRHGWDRHGSHHHHDSHHHHHRSGLRVHIGIPPIVIGHRPAPVYVRERVVVREPEYRPPVVVHQTVTPPPQTVIISQPPPPPPAPVYVPAHTAPVIRTTPPQATVVIPAGASAGAAPAAVATPTPVTPTVQGAAPLDVLPTELTLAAYRAGDTIMVVVKGINPAGAFSTALTAGELHGESPVVVLRNTPVPGGAAAGETEFHVTIAIHLERAVSAVTVLVADKAYRVQIVDVPSLS